MKEIRIHGRGGQGVVTSAELLAIAAFEDGKFSQAFPFFGFERRGAPIVSFVRISDSPIRLRSHIYNPDYLIVQDPTLVGVVEVTSGVRPDGMVIVNTEKEPEKLELEAEAQVRTINATKIAMDVLGRPIMNTALIGAFARATGEISVESIKHAVMNRFPGEMGEKNAEAVQKAYDMMRG
ncbi:MAG: pyruvate ferredoxin oxidoreductase subunit gamma [Methanocellales archaeon]|nr:pyruvate ferredoxin oxidoreductase subunit gamma [Methanocellales archaeon]